MSEIIIFSALYGIYSLIFCSMVLFVLNAISAKSEKDKLKLFRSKNFKLVDGDKS